MLVCSVIVQFTVERLKQPFAHLLPEHRKKTIVPLIALAVGLLIAAGSRLCLFTAMGIPFHYGWLGYALTGVAFSGGSGAFNELIKSVAGRRHGNLKE